MPEEKTVRVDQIEGLETYIQQQVRATIRQTAVPMLEDMEEIRKSPAGMLIRLEDKVEALELKMDERFRAVDQRFEALETKMDQRFEAIDQRFEAIDQRFADLQRSMEQQLATIKWAIALLFPFIFAILGKLFLMK